MNASSEGTWGVHPGRTPSLEPLHPGGVSEPAGRSGPLQGGAYSCCSFVVSEGKGGGLHTLAVDGGGGGGLRVEGSQGSLCHKAGGLVILQV